MQKEIDSIQQLEQRKASLSGIIRQRESIGQKIGTDKVWIGFQPQGESRVRIDRVIIRSTPEATTQVGYARKAVRENISSLNTRVDEINNEIQVRNHTSTLSQIEKLVASKDLNEDDLRFHQQQFETLQEQNPSLRKAVDRIRKEEEEKRIPEVQGGIPAFPEDTAEVKSEKMQEQQDIAPINNPVPEVRTIVLSQPDNSVEERRDYVFGIVREYVRNKYGSSESISFIGEKMVDLLSPVEMRFRGKWGERKGEPSFREWRSKVNSDYNILGNPQIIPPKSIMPEAQRLRQIIAEMQNQYEIGFTAEEIVFNTFNECLNMLASNIPSYKAYMQFAFGRQDIRDVRIAEINRGVLEGRHTRGLGVDVNPPGSRTEWRS